MDDMFSDATSFNGDISKWDVSRVVTDKTATPSKMECVSIKQKAGASARQLRWRGGAVPPDACSASATIGAGQHGST